MEIDEIKRKLIRGDYDLIAQLTGYSIITVRSQLNGTRTLVEKVKEAAELVIVTRENMLNTQV